jgi:phage gp29-like protein
LIITNGLSVKNFDIIASGTVRYLIIEYSRVNPKNGDESKIPLLIFDVRPPDDFNAVRRKATKKIVVPSSLEINARADKTKDRK